MTDWTSGDGRVRLVEGPQVLGLCVRAALREVITAAVVQSDGAVRVEGDLVRALPAVVVADKTGEAEGTCTESATRIVFVFRKAG